MRKKKLWLLYPVFALLLAFSLVVPTYALEDPVPLPHNFYGSLTIGTEPVPAETKVGARGAGVMTTEANPITTTEGGQYGGPGPLDPKLEVQGYIDEGTPIKFYVDGVRAQCREHGTKTWLDSYPWHTGALTELDLNPVGITNEITDLIASNPTQNSIDLTWTTPAAGTHTYSFFDVRYSITSDNWDKATWAKATRVVGEPTPVADTTQGMKVKGLDSDTTYYFAMKLVDEEGFVGLLSDIVSATTWDEAEAPSDITPPAQITDLAANPGSPATTRVILVWTAPGDDENEDTATSYEIRRSTSEITEANWSSATIIYNNIVPQAAGGSESFVARLAPNRTYYFAIQAKDEVGNASPTSNSPSRPTAANLPTITGISPTIGDNSGPRTLTIDGDYFVDGGTNVVRFGSGKNTFDLTNVTCGISTQLTAKVPKGAPTGTYKVRVINDNGPSKRNLATYEVTEADTPLPLVTNLIPQMAASNSAVSGVKIFGKNLADATGVSFGDTEATSFTVVSSGTKITVDVPGLSAGEYDVKVTTSAGTNEISGVKFVVSDPVAITEDTTEDTTTSEVVELDTNVIPVQLTLTTDKDETATQATDVDAEIEVVIPPKTKVKDSKGNDYTGNIHPPRVVKPDESELTDLADNAVVIEMGNPEETIHFDQDFVATIVITADTEPVIWYYNKDTEAYELAGITDTKDGVDYVPGGTKLGQENDTYTMGLLLDHMSSYVAGVEPSITSAPPTVTAGSAFTITGTNFHDTAAKVYFSGTEGTILSLSTTQIRARFSTVGSYTLKVENPDELSDTISITLTTPPLSPSVTTGDATSITITSATLNGSLDSLGTDSSVDVSFEWGETSGAYDNETTPKAMTATDAFSADLSNLSANTTYYFRAKAMGDGTSYGDESSFTTVTITFTITATAGEGGTISPSGEVVVNYGASQAFTITPDTGYEIADVLVDGESIGAEASYLFENVTAAHTIDASFATVETFTITATAGEGGTISPLGDVVVNYGASQAFAITPDTGYEIADVLVDGESIGAEASYLFENVTAAHIIDATFAADIIAPTVISVSPEVDATGMAVDTVVTATFSEAINEATLSFTLDGVAGSVTYSGTTATFTPSANLSYGTRYTASIQASDLAGNPMAEAHTWSFTTTMIAPDTTPPTVVSVSPSANATGVSITTRVSATFDEAIDEAALVFTLDSVAGTVSYDSGTKTATFAPSANLLYITRYTASISASDLAGNPMVAPYSCSFTTRARPAPGGRGEGEGYEPPAPPGTTDVRGKVTTTGRFTRSVTATSEDELCTLTIPKDTVGLTEELEPLDEINILEMDEPPPPPVNAHVVGLAYDFGPDGATFEPAITLTWSYDTADIPEGVAEYDLVIAYYDEEAGEWVELEGCVVDPVTKTITAPVSHFTTFAIVVSIPPPPPAPAAFSVTNLLVIKPLEIQPKEAVTITVSVANIGGTEGSYTVVLKINGVKEAEKRVTIAAGRSQSVSFSVSKEDAGTYSLVVDGLSASFTVVAPAPVVAPPPPPAPPVPAPPAPPAPPVVPTPLPEVIPPPAPNWPLIGGIIAGAIIVAVLSFFLVRKRRMMKCWGKIKAFFKRRKPEPKGAEKKAAKKKASPD